MMYLFPDFTLVLAFVTAVPPTAEQQPAPPTELQNAGFESAVLHAGWTLHVYGAQPQLALDRTAPHQGHQSLRVSADAASDTAFGQEVQLQPGRWYRLTGWVRTEKLDP